MGIIRYVKNIFGDTANVMNGAGSLDLSGLRSAAGVEVTEDTVIQMASVFACIRNSSEDIAGLPIHLLQKADNRRQKKTDHPSIWLLSQEPNEWMTPYDFRESMQYQAELFGSAYAYIKRDVDHNPIALYPLHSPYITPTKIDGQLYYLMDAPGLSSPERISNYDVLHIHGVALDGINGLQPVKMLRQAFGTALATESYASQFFEQGTHKQYALEAPEGLSDEARENLIKSLTRQHTGMVNAFKVMLLEEGVKANAFGDSPKDIQLIEARKYHDANMARIYRMPPHMIGDLERSTNNNIEQQALEYVKYSMRPRAIRWEQECNAKLLTTAERKSGNYFKISMEGLLRGDSSARSAFYRELFNIGVLSQNDIRELEDMDPIDGGDTYYVPLNMRPADEPYIAASGQNTGQTQRSSTTQNEARQDESRVDHEDPVDTVSLGSETTEKRGYCLTPERRARTMELRSRASNRHRQTISAAVTELLKQEVKEIREAAERFLPDDRDGFSNWIQEYYGEQRKQDVSAAMTPAVLAYAEEVHEIAAEDIGQSPSFGNIKTFAIAYVAGYATRHVIQSRKDIYKRLKDDDPIKAIDKKLSEWLDSRADSVANHEAVRARGAISRETYKEYGVREIVWVNTGSEPCPICTELGGTVVGIDKPFIAADSVSDAPADQKQQPIRHSSTIHHPPAHDGCECEILPN